MLPKQNRFHNKKYFLRVQRIGKQKRASILYARFLFQKIKKPNRFAVVVSRKFDNRAVKRNLVRRRVYQAIEEAQWHLPQGQDIIIYLQAGIFEKWSSQVPKYSDILQDIKSLQANNRNHKR